MTDVFPRENGQLKLNLGPWGLWQTITIHGGPYRGAYVPNNDEHFGVCLTEQAPRLSEFEPWRSQGQNRQLQRPVDLHMPINDYSVPKQDQMFVGSVVKEIISQAINGKDVFVGCLGGWGRTGLVLSLVAKAAGQDDPVAYVRKNYTPSAVEMPSQEDYVELFDIGDIRGWLLTTVLKAKVPFLRRFL